MFNVCEIDKRKYTLFGIKNQISTPADIYIIHAYIVKHNP